MGWFASITELFKLWHGIERGGQKRGLRLLGVDKKNNIVESNRGKLERGTRSRIGWERAWEPV